MGGYGRVADRARRLAVIETLRVARRPAARRSFRHGVRCLPRVSVGARQVAGRLAWHLEL